MDGRERFLVEVVVVLGAVDGGVQGRRLVRMSMRCLGPWTFRECGGAMDISSRRYWFDVGDVDAGYLTLTF